MNQIIRTNDHETIILFFLTEAAYNKENRRYSEAECKY